MQKLEIIQLLINYNNKQKINIFIFLMLINADNSRFGANKIF